MKKLDKARMNQIVTALVILLLTTAVIIGAWRTNIGKTVPLENAAAVYKQACDKAAAQTNLYYKVTGVKTTTLRGTSYEESFTQLITYESLNTAEFRGCVEEDILIGNHDIKSFEFFSGGVGYFTTQGASFQSSMSVTEYTERYTPVVAIDPSRYAEITGTTNFKESTITFSKAASAESWLTTENIILNNVAATATLDSNGNLTASTYNISYTANGIGHALNLTVQVLNTNIPTVQLPNTQAYREISNIDAPKALERSCGYLMTLNNIASTYNDTIFSQASGYEQAHEIHISTSAAPTWSAGIDTTTSLVDSSKPGDIKTITKTERFENGVCSYTTDGNNFIQDKSIDLTTMQSYCQNLLIGTILLPEHITSVEVIETEDAYQFHFQPDEEFANILAQDACLALHNDATVLTNLAEAYTTDTLSCHLYVSKQTGFPTSSGFHYSGTYTISDLPYTLSFKANQTYALSPEPVKEDKNESTEPQDADPTEPS